MIICVMTILILSWLLLLFVLSGDSIFAPSDEG